AAEVGINGAPLVPLGGDYWHMPFRMAQSGKLLIRVVKPFPGVLDSNPFTIGQRYIAFLLGGSATGVAIELRIPSTKAAARRRQALDAPDADDFVAVLRAHPSGSDVLSEQTWDLRGGLPAQSLVGATAKARLRVDSIRSRPSNRLL